MRTSVGILVGVAVGHTMSLTFDAMFRPTAIQAIEPPPAESRPDVRAHEPRRISNTSHVTEAFCLMMRLPAPHTRRSWCSNVEECGHVRDALLQSVWRRPGRAGQR
jgi:hypothetical protein